MLSTIPDGFLGRKQLLFLSTLTMSVTGISIFFSSNIWSYVFLKFLVGFARSQTCTYALVLICERVSTRWRPRATMIPFTLFVLGFMSLSGIAYLARHVSWRVLYLCTSVPAAVHSVFLCFFALESPRWLHLQGRNQEAIEVLKRISPETRPYLESVSSRLLEKQNLEQAPRYTIKDLFIRNWAFKRIILVMIIMFGLGIVLWSSISRERHKTQHLLKRSPKRNGGATFLCHNTDIAGEVHQKKLCASQCLTRRSVRGALFRPKPSR